MVERMKRLLMTLGLSLTLLSPVQAAQVIKKQPTVTPYSLAAMGCMILLECTEGVEQLTVESEIFKSSDFDLFRDEIKAILVGLDASKVPVYLAPRRYWTPGTIGLYKPDLNRLYINEYLLRDPREFLGTLRHEGWHAVQDCMAGGISTPFMAQVHQDKEIPDWVIKQTTKTYTAAGMARAIPWESDANWAEEQSNVTAIHLEKCAKGPLWEQVRPTPMTMEWLIGCGWMKPQEGHEVYTANQKSNYCVPGKF